MRGFSEVTLRRYAAGASVSVLGCALLIIPAFDIWEDVGSLSWALTSTVVENALFVFLAGVLVGGEVWLVRSGWETDAVWKVAKRTVGATALVSFLIGWAVAMQLLVMNSLKPWVLAMDGVLVGSVSAFALSVSSVRAGRFQAAASREQAINDRLETLYQAASDLESTTTRTEAYDRIEAAVAEVGDGSPFRIVVDGETVVEHGGTDTDRERTTESVPIGTQGHIELLGRPFERHEVVTVELFGSYLEETLQRIERESTLRDERDVMEFINQTVRHDLLGDLALVQARLETLAGSVDFEDDANREHLAVARDRAEEMESFVRTMRTYMQTVLDDDHSLEPRALVPVVDAHVDAIARAHQGVVVERGDVPAVEVLADDLLDRVVVNLLTNAVEHNTAPEPRVEVDGERLDGAVRLRVADNGPGIPDERRESIFERGERGKESDGSGFGLYLVEDVVESYGGEVSVRERESGGTVFEVRLPLADSNEERGEGGE